MKKTLKKKTKKSKKDIARNDWSKDKNKPLKKEEKEKIGDCFWPFRSE